LLEQFQTDTADYADFLLPVTTFLEHTDVYFSYGHYYLQMARPALPPPGETKSNVEIFRLLAKRMGFEESCFDDSDDDMIRALLSSDHPFIQGITLEQLDEQRSVRLQIGQPFLPFAEGGFGTASGKCEFRAETLDYTPPVESRHGDPELRQRFPLEFISPKVDEGLNSTFGNRAEVDRATDFLSICPADAEKRGIVSGDEVRVFNGRGSCLLVADVGGAVAPGVVSAPSIRWNKKARDRKNVNVLTSERLTDLGAGATFYSCLVEVEKVHSA
jgi:anaerobic selenocysteine-containing dehydrogenase